jgi:hypothetical protein
MGQQHLIIYFCFSTGGQSNRLQYLGNKTVLYQGALYFKLQQIVQYIYFNLEKWFSNKSVKDLR